MYSRFLLVSLVFAMLMLISCKSGSNRNDLPADVISNPNSANGSSDPSGLPVITFEKDFHDFGRLRSGERVTYSFKFKNTGKSMLLISSVTSSCGCTITDYPRQPIKPGEGGTVDVSFDSENRHGLQNKTVTVFSNTQPPTTLLSIRANVLQPSDM